MNNEPIAFVTGIRQFDPVMVDTVLKVGTPLYTHPAKELNDGGEPVKNATYWKRQYNEMSALNDGLKSSLYHANEQIKYLEYHPAKTLTDEEILELTKDSTIFEYREFDDDMVRFARAILRKAQEK